MHARINRTRAISFVALLWCMSVISGANAQETMRHCSSDAPSFIQAVVGYTDVDLRRGMRALDGSPIEVLIAFHLIQNTAGDNSATLEQLTRQIDVLNAAFSGSFVFSLSSVETTINDEWFLCQIGSQPFNQMLQTLRVGDARMLNVYVYDPYFARPGDSVGYSNFPWSLAANSSSDGVSVFFGALPGGLSVRFGQGKTLVHEVGHWLGLLHTFQRPNPVKPLSARNNGCMGRGDFISDTPAEKKPHSSCARRVNSCPAKGFDPLKNYMSYAEDVCLSEFTPKQLKRMRGMWEAYRVRG